MQISDYKATMERQKTTIYKEDGKFSVSEMVKYQVKKLELNEKNIMTLEFYLSDQAELQTDGTMEFQCN